MINYRRHSHVGQLSNNKVLLTPNKIHIIDITKNILILEALLN